MSRPVAIDLKSARFGSLLDNARCSERPHIAYLDVLCGGLRRSTYFPGLYLGIERFTVEGRQSGFEFPHANQVGFRSPFVEI